KLVLILSLLTITSTPALAQQNPIVDLLRTPPPPPMNEIFKQEIRLWRTLQKHDLDTLQSLLLPDFIEVEETIQTREQLLTNLKTCTIGQFTIQKPETRMMTPDIAVIAYRVKADLTCDQTHSTEEYNASTTWIRRDGKWLAQIHTESPIAKS
ncbi:MAG TPA: nuclear transport factor 2 family protein, partial [Edaphobacter sp.]